MKQNRNTSKYGSFPHKSCGKWDKTEQNGFESIGQVLFWIEHFRVEALEIKADQPETAT